MRTRNQKYRNKFSVNTSALFFFFIFCLLSHKTRDWIFGLNLHLYQWSQVEPRQVRNASEFQCSFDRLPFPVYYFYLLGSSSGLCTLADVLCDAAKISILGQTFLTVLQDWLSNIQTTHTCSRCKVSSEPVSPPRPGMLTLSRRWCPEDHLMRDHDRSVNEQHFGTWRLFIWRR